MTTPENQPQEKCPHAVVIVTDGGANCQRCSELMYYDSKTRNWHPQAPESGAEEAIKCPQCGDTEWTVEAPVTSGQFHCQFCNHWWGESSHCGNKLPPPDASIAKAFATLLAQNQQLAKERDEWREYAKGGVRDGAIRPDELVQECDRIKSQFIAMEGHAMELTSERDELKAQLKEAQEKFDGLTKTVLGWEERDYRAAQILGEIVDEEHHDLLECCQKVASAHTLLKQKLAEAEKERMEFAERCFIAGCESAGDQVTADYAQMRWQQSYIKKDLSNE